jgi:hypothetical protein
MSSPLAPAKSMEGPRHGMEMRRETASRTWMDNSMPWPLDRSAMRCMGMPKHSAVTVLRIVSATAHVNQNANALYRPSCVSTCRQKPIPCPCETLPPTRTTHAWRTTLNDHAPGSSGGRR